jgi:DNA polymerase III epsilon subunit-like protein
MTDTVLIIIDTETTGLTPREDFVQLGAVFHVEHAPFYSNFCELAIPNVAISKGASDIHGWTLPALEQAGARTSQEVAERFIEDAAKFVDGRPYVLAGHNLEFDLRVLNGHACLKHMVPEAYGTICTRQLAERLSPMLFNHQLATVFEGWGLDPKGLRPHDALSDAWACFRLVRHYASGASIPYREIADWLAKPAELEIMAFGAHKGKEFKDIPEGYLKWLTGSANMRADWRHTAQKELERRAGRTLGPEVTVDDDDDVPF